MVKNIGVKCLVSLVLGFLLNFFVPMFLNGMMEQNEPTGSIVMWILVIVLAILVFLLLWPWIHKYMPSLLGTIGCIVLSLGLGLVLVGLFFWAYGNVFLKIVNGILWAVFLFAMDWRFGKK